VLVLALNTAKKSARQGSQRKYNVDCRAQQLSYAGVTFNLCRQASRIADLWRWTAGQGTFLMYLFLLYTTIPLFSANSVWSLPQPTLSPGWNCARGHHACINLVNCRRRRRRSSSPKPEQPLAVDDKIPRQPPFRQTRRQTRAALAQ